MIDPLLIGLTLCNLGVIAYLVYIRRTEPPAPPRDLATCINCRKPAIPSFTITMGDGLNIGPFCEPCEECLREYFAEMYR